MGSPNVIVARKLARWVQRMVAVVVVCVWSPAIGQAQDRGLLLEVRVAKTPVVIGEPVYVTLRLSNASDESQAVYPAVNLSSGVITIHIVDAGGDTRAFLPLSLGEPDAEGVSLPPREALAAMQPVFFGGRGWTFKSPGTYRIFGVYDHGAVRDLRSATATLEVISGDGAGERLVGGGNESEQAAKFLLWFGGDHLRQGIAELEEFSRGNPQSPIGSYYYLAMASNLAAPFRDFSVGQVREARPADALQYLSRLNPDVLPPGLVVRRYLIGARAAGLLGNASERARLLAAAQAMLDADPLLYELFHMAIEEIAAAGL